ncbi:MAG: type I pullulanase [Beggiatoa sp. IS2]|nr:MAG: type I pullulanase [Beggiatoa sp. IS2]
MEHTQIISAFMDDDHKISIYFSTNFDYSVSQAITLEKEGIVIPFRVIAMEGIRMMVETELLDPKKWYVVSFEQSEVEVTPHLLLDQPAFHYPGNDLGCVCTPSASTFKVFAPTATAITLNLYQTLETTEKQTVALTETVNGVWAITVPQDLKGTYYSFTVAGASSLFNPLQEVIDPYAYCVVGKTGRALIVDLNDYIKITPAPFCKNLEDLVIYEIHIRDVSIDENSGYQYNGKFLAITEENTHLKGDPTITTLVEHFKELGVNALQIMPLQDFDNVENDSQEYAWGYMPRFFNTPDGSYASHWKGDAKIRELKYLINFLHEQGFKVILDVVYNHTAEGFSKENIFSFNAFVPYYYYRLLNGQPSNGSGCGNEFRTEAFMGQKFILDSLKFWTEFYGFDGYRFDLMGLIDFNTTEKIIAELKQLKPDMIIYGEPWAAGPTPLPPLHKGGQRNRGFAVFNDDFRDAIKGHFSLISGKGYLQTSGDYHYDSMIQGILGSINTFAAAPRESLNYVEIHDNHTLFDKLYFSLTGQTQFVEPQGVLLKTIIAMHKLAAFIILMSQGIPVLHLGQDFLRTKRGIGNSYDGGDVINKISWQRKKDFYPVFLYYKTLIEIRNHHPLLRITSDPGIRESIDFNWEHFPPEKGQGLAYVLEGGQKWGDSFDKMLFLINPYEVEVTLSLRDTWKKLLIGDEYFQENHPLVSHSLTVPRLSGSVLFC